MFLIDLMNSLKYHIQTSNVYFHTLESYKCIRISIIISKHNHTHTKDHRYTWISFIILKYNHTHTKDHRYTRTVISMVSSCDAVYVIIEERKNGSPHHMDSTHTNHTMATAGTFARWPTLTRMFIHVWIIFQTLSMCRFTMPADFQPHTYTPLLDSD